jgi:hypothetical protein
LVGWVEMIGGKLTVKLTAFEDTPLGSTELLAVSV